MRVINDPYQTKLQVMAGAASDEPADFYYQDDLYLERPDDKYSCPICLCPVQRQAHLTECCGRHFCLPCIRRLRNERKPCPMCKESPLAIFPNKERQREIKQLRVRCPLSLPVYRDATIGGRGRANSEDGTTEAQGDCKASSENQSDLTNDFEATDLSKAVDQLKFDDFNVSTCGGEQLSSSTEQIQLESAELQQVNETERSVHPDVARDAPACDWTGELGHVEKHVSDVHGAQMLRRIRSSDSGEVTLPTAPPRQQRVHIHHRHHVHSTANVPNHRNVTFHYVRTPEGVVNFHYHVNRSRPFNEVSNRLPTAPNSNSADVGSPSSAIDQVDSSSRDRPEMHQNTQRVQPHTLSDISSPSPLNAENTRLTSSDHAPMATGQTGSQQSTSGQTCLSTTSACSTEASRGQTSPDQQPQVPTDQSESDVERSDHLAGREELPQQGGDGVANQPLPSHHQRQRVVLLGPGQRPSSLQYPPGVVFVRRSCPHHHMQGTHRHHHHSHGPPFRHHHHCDPPPHHRHGPPPPHSHGPHPHGPPPPHPHGPPPPHPHGPPPPHPHGPPPPNGHIRRGHHGHHHGHGRRGHHMHHPPP